ncbi:major capsid protein [Humitalea rosea]|nr:major capsid protein [Humitalea rosea]
MSLSQVRVVDPVLTTVARGYTQSNLVGSVLFPEVPVDLSGGQILEFGKEAFRLVNARRAPGGATKLVDFGYLGAPYALLQDSLGAKVPREWMRDASRSPGIDLGTRAVNTVMGQLRTGLEYQQAVMARTAASYAASNKVTLAGGARWSTATVDPSVTIETGREAIRAAVGVYPNVALLSAKAFAAARNNPILLNRFRYTTAASITEEMLAALWNVDRVVVGKGVFASGADDAFADIWGTDAILAYSAIGAMGAEVPSYGYTYTMRGHPMVEPAYWDNGTKSWVCGVTYERAPVLAGVSAGYLITTAAD